MKTLFFIMLINGDVYQWCDVSEEEAYTANIDYLMIDIDYIENTFEPCNNGEQNL